MVRRRTLITGIITIFILILTNNFWLSTKPVDLQFELYGVDNVTVSYKLYGGLFSSKEVTKIFDLQKSPKIKIDNNGLLTFNKAKILVDTEFSGGG